MWWALVGGEGRCGGHLWWVRGDMMGTCGGRGTCAKGVRVKTFVSGNNHHT